MTRQADYAVVGAGLLGLATARALAKRGREVTLLEQATPGHELAGSAGNCRIFRLGYEDPFYVSLARRAREPWQLLEEESFCSILSPAPHLTLGAGLGVVASAMASAGARTELLMAAEVADRFPGIAADGPALLEPESAVIAADTALTALAAGVPDLRPGVRVTAVADDGRRVALDTSEGSLSARVAVICSGPWTAGLLAGGARLPAAPTLEQVAYLAPSGEAGTSGTAPAEMPIFIAYDAQVPYGLPVPGSALYKTGIHHGGGPADPERLDQAEDPVLAERLAEVARRYLPGFDPRPKLVERCVYDNTPDEDFVVDRIGNVVVGCGTSGHGFKFGPLLGEWLADLATGEGEGPPARFALGRFRSSRGDT
jgi:sarcosine oxidase